MKKIAFIILTIVLVATMMLAFTGCAQATTQDQLRDIWLPYEKYVYDVVGNDQTGTYTVEIIRNDASTITIGDMTLNNVKEGYIIKSTLEIEGAVHESACYMQKTNGASLFVPIASYTNHPVIENGKVAYNNVISGKYEGKHFKYTKVEYGAREEGEIKLASPYYDNNQIHQLIRAMHTFSASFSFNVPLATENELARLTVSSNNTEEITWGENTTTKCNVLHLSRQTLVNGASQILYYSESPVKVDGWDLKHVLIRFKEPIGNDDYMVYTLKSISRTPDQN
jgi:hypothetical protein